METVIAMKLVFRLKKILFCYQTIMNYAESAYKTLEKDTELLETYDKIFKEQLSLRYVEQTDTPSLRPGQVHHLPHHPVIIIDKETTKVRAAFDTSTKIKGNPSLHDC